MQRLKMLGLAVLAVFALAAVMVSSASALPTVTGEKGGTVTATGSATGENIAELSTALSAPITSEKVKLETSFASGESAGTYDAMFTNALFELLKCNTPGDEDGVILVPGTVHLVDAPGSVKAAAFLISGTLLIECGPLGKPTLTIKITGGTIGALLGIVNGTPVTKFKGELKCTKPNNGKQALKELINGEGKAVKVILSANLGLGAESACEEVKEAVTLELNQSSTFAGF